MSVQIFYDASDLRRIERLFATLPSKMQRVAFGRAAARTRQVVERNYARFASAQIRVPQRLIKEAMKSRLEDGDILLRVKDKNIALSKLHPRLSEGGVMVRGRDMYRNESGPGGFTFFVMGSGAKSSHGPLGGEVFLRGNDTARTPVGMVFGPSAAHAANKKPQEYENILAEIARHQFAHVILQQVTYLLTRR